MSLILSVSVWLARTVYAAFKLLPVQNKVVLISRKNSATSIDFRLLVDKLESGYPKTKVVVLNHPLNGPIRSLERFFEQMYHLATARAAIVDTYVPAVSILRHKPGLVVVQIWHALGAIKRFGRQTLDQPGGSPAWLARVMHMHENYTYVVTGSLRTVPTYSEAFGISPDQIKPLGLPRVDYLLDKPTQAVNCAKVLAALPELKNKKVILYAPTFRKSGGIDPAKMAEALGPDYRLLVSQHRLDKTELKEADNLVINHQFDVLELLAVADAVVTDYSAIAFEAAVLGLPLYFYAYDFKTYQTDRGLAMDYKIEMPGAIAENLNTLTEAILADDYDRDRIRQFASDYVTVQDGSSTERVIKLLGLDR